MKLSEEQQKVIHEVVHRVRTFKPSRIQGGAGTGKTTIIFELIQELRKQLKCFTLTAATTNEAARNIEAMHGERPITTHYLMGYGVHGRHWDGHLLSHLKRHPCLVLIIDEVSMLDKKIYQDILKLRSHVIPVFVGDLNQLTVNLPPAFKDIKAFELTQNFRAKNNHIERFVAGWEDAKDVESIPRVSQHTHKDIIIKYDSLQAFKDEWRKEEEEKILIAYTNTIVEKYQQYFGGKKIMTIHKSQGRSIHSVFVDYTSFVSAFTAIPNKFNHPLSFNEFKRLAYVAFSRAEYQLHIFTGESRTWTKLK